MGPCTIEMIGKVSEAVLALSTFCLEITKRICSLLDTFVFASNVTKSYFHLLT